MTISLYDVSVPVFTRMLTNLDRILGKAEAWAGERKIDTTILVGSRLAPDMFPLSFQVQASTDHAKFGSSRLAGLTPPAWPDVEKTIPELRVRISTALDYLGTFGAESINGQEEREVTLRIAGKDVVVPAQTYLLNRALPNFYFHVTTAYDILRHNGVPVGKPDYLG